MTERIQRRRVRGWRAPSDALYVGRPSVWANLTPVTKLMTPRMVVLEFVSKLLEENPITVFAQAHRLEGHAIMCWCRTSNWCHGDVWIELARLEHHAMVRELLLVWKLRLLRATDEVRKAA